MFGRKKKDQKQTGQEQAKHYPIRSVSLEELRRAVHAFADHLAEGVNLSVLINEDLTIDYELLAPYLHAIPKETFYMSKETYEIFPESSYQLAKDLDMVQRGVDHYVKQTNELPMIEGDPYKKVSYFKLEKLNLLPYRPDLDFYITDEELLITYQKPE